jgi:hypothetical protein
MQLSLQKLTLSLQKTMQSLPREMLPMHELPHLLQETTLWWLVTMQ